METNFRVKAHRLAECKDLIQSLPSARFKHNPLKMLNDEYSITISLDVNDYTKLSELFNNWYNKDNPKPQPSKASILWNKTKCLITIYARSIGKFGH